MNHNHIQHACSLPIENGGELLTSEQARDMLQADELAWVHLDATHEATEPWLKENVSYLDEFIIHALLADETRPRFEVVGNGALIILRGVNLNENADPEDMISIRIWVDPHRIITTGRRPLKAVLDVRELILKGKHVHNSGGFLTAIVSRLIERMEPTLQQLDDAADVVEAKVLDEPNKRLRSEIVDIRQDAILLRRYIAPQKDAVSKIRNADLDWLDTKHKRSLQESYDRLLRYVEDLDTVRERAQIVQDELSNTLSDMLNKNMYILSVIAAIFLPLGFLTGLLGINVGGIPGTEDSNAFAIVCGLLTGIVLLQVLLFKKMKWF